ncbi:putative methyltransferase [Ascobolus immersus RN42]|uniref:Putative methyltransferase n=1 Tax=Ascobolus immersus RN42 TaxID=1160509 RepID=A0A3N4IF19_ASCIM|nr:putative methyltransferase [Ascobolus immersus RN42]
MAPNNYDEEELHPIEIGTEVYDDDTDGESFQSETTTLTSSVFNYVYENGRRYASDRKSEYLFPNDDKEQERLDIFHHLWGLVMDGKLYQAPLPAHLRNGGRVLDLGTGTGIWAIDFGDENPRMQVLGTDLSAIQPTYVPPNVKFEIDDFSDDWVYGEKFSYIHARALFGASVKDWSTIIKKAYDHLVPGGYLEFQEFDLQPFSEDNSLPGSHYLTYSDHFQRAGKLLGTRFDITPEDMREWYEAAGFVDVEVKKFRVPIGPWPKDPKFKRMGTVIAVASSTGFEAYGLALFTRVLGMSQEEARKLIDGAYTEISGKAKVHAVHWFFCIYGRKPTEEEERARRGKK